MEEPQDYFQRTRPLSQPRPLNPELDVHLNVPGSYTPLFQPIPEASHAPATNRPYVPTSPYPRYRPARNQIQLAVIPSSDDSDSSSLDVLSNPEDSPKFQSSFALQPSINSFLEECGLPPLALDQMTFDSKDSIVRIKRVCNNSTNLISECSRLASLNCAMRHKSLRAARTSLP